MIRSLFLALWICATLAGTPASARKVALIIANAHYQNSSALKNPASDAAKISDALNADKFDVVKVQLDLDVSHFHNALKEFAAEAEGADVALVYYAGHGILDNGTNWLIPVDATLKKEDDLDLEAVQLDQINFTIQNAKVRVVIIDACRDNPFRRGWTSATRGMEQRGLTAVNVDGQLTIFSAAPGQEAIDGVGANSPFADALAHRLVQPDLPVQMLGNAVRDDVLSATNAQQRPFSNASMSVTPYYLAGAGLAGAPGGEQNVDVDALAWEGALRADTIEGYGSYRDNNPNGRFVKLAAANIKRLEATRAMYQSAAQPGVGTGSTTSTDLNAYIKHQVDARDTAQDDAMKAYREQVEELARSTAAMREEYTRKVDEFHSQQSAYEDQRKDWMTRVEACNRGEARKCAGDAHAGKEALAPAPVPAAVATWHEALVICHIPTGNEQGRSLCEGPAGNGEAVLGSPDAQKMLIKLCDSAPNYRDLGVADRMRVYGCGYGLNPFVTPGKKGNLDVAQQFHLDDVAGRQDFLCADRSTRQCRIPADATAK